MILKTVKALKARFNYWLGVRYVLTSVKMIELGRNLQRSGLKLTTSSEKTILEIKARKFAPFKEASNCGKEIITIIEDDDLGPIYKN